MKIVELFENNNEWENTPINDQDLIRIINQKEAALEQHRNNLVDEIMRKFSDVIPNQDSFYLSKHMLHILLSNDPCPKLLVHQIIKLQRIDQDIQKIRRKGVHIKNNMKYFKYDPALAYLHAKTVRKGWFPEGEEAISKNANTAFNYAIEVIHRRFIKGEPVIATEPDLKQKYESRFGIKL